MKKPHKYTEEQKQYIRKIAPGRYNKEITEMFNERFGTNLSVGAINSFKSNHGIKSNVARGLKPGTSKLFTKEQQEFIEEHVKGKSNADLTKLINDTFGLSLTVRQVATYKKNHGLNSGLTGQFEKGHEPWNKGKKGLINKGSEKGWFRKGHKPANYRPIGSERIADGYIQVKVKETKWRHKHVVLWEKHYGKVPKNHTVVFLDQNKLNINIENLELISRSELAIMNKEKLFSNNPEITKSGIAYVRLSDRISELEIYGGNRETFEKYIKLAEMKGIQRQTFIARIRRGWTLHDAINKPLHYRPKITKGGQINA